MHSETQRRLVQLTQLLLLLMVFAPTVLAQDPQLQQLTAPPPIKAIPRGEREQLQQAKDPKTRLRLTLDIAAGHLAAAERYTAQPSFEGASAEIGVYHALIADALTFLGSLKHDSNKTRDLYKRLELTLRADGPRLTSLRRVTPLEFAVWIKEVEDFARDGRTEALNSFYGNTVVRDGQKSDADKPNDKAKNTSIPPKVQQP
jgi:hypothetical protein